MTRPSTEHFRIAKDPKLWLPPHQRPKPWYVSYPGSRCCDKRFDTWREAVAFVLLPAAYRDLSHRFRR